MTRGLGVAGPQLSIYDRIVLEAPNGWRWATVRVNGDCASCDGALALGAPCVRRGRWRVCESCARKRALVTAVSIHVVGAR